MSITPDYNPMLVATWLTAILLTMDLNTFVSRQKPACPCCVFLMEDLFLPPTPTDPSDGATPLLPNEVVSPQEALKYIQLHAQEILSQQQDQGERKPPMLLVDTHNHAHLRRDRSEAYLLPADDTNAFKLLEVVSLTLAVEPSDWDDALQYSAAELSKTNRADLTLMGLGIHPWYLGDSIEPNGPWKQRLSDLLQEHPSAIVGEIGLCKMARCARSHPEGKAKGFEGQRVVLENQLEVAVQHQRPVSIHCVQQHGVFLDLLKETLVKVNAEPKPILEALIPPAIAMHSFTGTAHHVKQLLQWEASLFGEGPNDKKKKKRKEPADPSINRQPLLYFGFSHIGTSD